MTKQIFKTVGEGGAHAHRLLPNQLKTAFDGRHKHLFFVNGRILMTDFSGEHEHGFNPQTGEVGPQSEPHGHTVTVRTASGPQSFETDKGGSHPHELQAEMTTLSGVHQHTLPIGEDSYVSLVPGDLIQEVMSAAKSTKKFKGLSLKSTHPMESDFALVKKLNQSQFQDILRTAVEKSLIKRMATLGEGLRIESLILSRERFSDVGVATRFVLDQGLNIEASRVLQDEGIFTFQVSARESFEESTLQRIRITEGVDAVIGFLAEKEEKEEGEEDQPEGNVLASEEVETEKGMKLVNWSSNETITGSYQELLQEISEKFEIDRKFVCVEPPRTGLIKYIEENFEVDHAVYDDIGDERLKSVVDMKAHTDDIDCFVTKVGNRNQVIFFFDSEESILGILGNPPKDYEPGTYMVKSTMMGYTLLPVHLDEREEPIFDEDVIESLKHDTETFFSKRDFYLNNPVERLEHKRGVFMIGPPGNGKTTFIKHYLSKVTKKNGRFGILIDCSDQFDSDVQKFLESALGDAEKIICLEDIDSVAECSFQRASLLNFMDGVGSMDKTLFIATSNHPGKLDEAIMNRPSRFDKKYLIDLPSLKMRVKFLQKFFPDLGEEDLDRYAKETEGFSGAYFKELFILKHLQEISITEAIKSLQEQVSMVYKNDHSEAIKALCFEESEFQVEQESGEEKLDALKRKFKSTLSNYEEERSGKARHMDDKKPKKTKKSFKTTFEILQKNDEKRLVTGPVLIPENVDLQDDILSADEIEKAQHGYMIKLAYRDDPDFLCELGFKEVGKAGERGFMHVDFSRKAAVVETFTAPVDFEMNGRTITKGTWVMTMKVFDDEVWALVKTGKITGFSIGGRSKSKPENLEE